ncbi:transposase, partial [Escherichia coli]
FLFCLYRVSTAIYVILTTITTKPIYLAYKLKLII